MLVSKVEHTNFLKTLNEKLIKIKPSEEIDFCAEQNQKKYSVDFLKRIVHFDKAIAIVKSKQFKIIGLCVLAFAGIAFTFWGVHYFHRPINLTHNLNNLKIDSPITVNFSQPIQKNIVYSISPSIEGSWKPMRNIFGITSLKFYPSKKLTPGSTYNLTVKNIKPLLAAKPSTSKQTIPINVEKPATINSITPADKAINLPVNSSVVINLASPNHGLRKLVLKSDGQLVNEEPTTNDDITFTWNFAQPLRQGQTYHLSILDLKQTDKAKQTLLTTTFKTVAEPQIVAATDTDHFYPGDKINITFDQDMKQNDRFFKFGFAGNGYWKDLRNYTFEPSGLSAGSSYTYTVSKAAESVAGGVIESDHVFNISPPGVAYVTGSSPRGNNVALGTAISFSFDQPVDHNTAQAAFSISPNVGGNFSWSGNTLSFQPAGLDYQTNYVATIGPGVKGVYGLTSVKSFTNSFITTYRIIKLGVPYFRQIHALSCEEASLRMALAYRGINVSDNDVLAQVGYSPKPRDTVNNFWDNPYKMFVGDVDGKMGVSGWGVYGQPIANASQVFGRNASYINGISANQIAQAIYDNNPVVLWGIVGTYVKQDSWNTAEGVVQAPKNAHVRTVYGVAGSPANPVGFYLHDPLYGELYWTTAQLRQNMSFGNSSSSQGVIVY